jgi:DNA-binding protein H-NS
MSDKNSLASIAEAKAKLAEELRLLEEQEVELHKQEASNAFEQVTSLLRAFASHFDSKQRAEIAGYVVTGVKTKKASTGPKQEVAPKYWLPHSQETWSGRGRPPRAFSAWEGTQAYNAWKAKHPEEKFPKYPG